MSRKYLRLIISDRMDVIKEKYGFTVYIRKIYLTFFKGMVTFYIVDVLVVF